MTQRHITRSEFREIRATALDKAARAEAFTPPDLSREEWAELANCLSEEAMRRDDDGNEGAFDASPLGPIYKKIWAALR